MTIRPLLPSYRSSGELLGEEMGRQVRFRNVSKRLPKNGMKSALVNVPVENEG